MIDAAAHRGKWRAEDVGRIGNRRLDIEHIAARSDHAPDQTVSAQHLRQRMSFDVGAGDGVLADQEVRHEAVVLLIEMRAQLLNLELRQHTRRKNSMYVTGQVACGTRGRRKEVADEDRTVRALSLIHI